MNAMLEMFMKQFIGLLPPEAIQMISDMPATLDRWEKWMIKHAGMIGHIDGRIETIDNKVSYLCDGVDDVREKLTLLMSESNLTPELHDAIIANSVADPRQSTVVAAEYEQ
jgi:hypothetical protein